MTKKTRRRTTKFTAKDKSSFIHPTMSYNLSPERQEIIDRVNHYYRIGLTFQDIAQAINKSERTVKRLYFGYADSCLSDKQLEELKQLPGSTVTWTKVISRIADKGETPDRTKVLMPVYTNIRIQEFEEDELTDTQPVPFEIIKTQYIPRSPNSNFGKSNNEHESWEYVDVIDSELTITKLKPYVVIYSHAACSI